MESAVTTYLHSDEGVTARARIPADWAPYVPMNGASWRFTVEGRRATATSSPPGAVTETRRVWFELKLEKRGEAWVVLPPGVTFVHAWAKR